ncbi:unnamed protein product [Mytilus coruscus]|uniref:Uncharacterized protein n=1 Tax=Mytilus coruscus TaxID=42192 RepID=A0A6J8ASD5_MYTCO|nr:unnamed protein product [Mytilus coruscus]
MVAFGGPSHEIIINGNWYELQFNGPPREITVGNQRLLVGLPCPPPDVKILDPIENQSLKEPDVDKSGSKRDKRRGSDDRNSPSFGQKKPISILDLDIAKPPGLRNKERLKGSPLYDERSRSPDSHRDGRRRSPHRRHSPDRRGGSPQINDQFNGPSINQPGPPFVPGQPFNQGGPNQPFQPRPNQPFPPNQQFPGPNQPPFPTGPNIRFPPGPNQPPFMPGPNQPFPSGPNQIFPPGQNQQMPGPGAMQPFQLGPRPMMQEEGSQGPHPMFQQGPPGQPLQSMPGMPPNMPVMSQSMPMPGQSMPIQGPPVSVAGQPLPGQPMMPPGSVPISVMNQPINPGIMSQPLGGPPNLMPSQQPPTLQPEPLNVESLLQRLIKVGLIAQSGEKAKEKEQEKEKEEKKSESESPQKKEEEPSDGKEKKKPVRLKLSKPQKIPDLTEMKINILKKQNQREKKEPKISRFRSWFYELDDWLEYEDVGDSEERAHSSLFEQLAAQALETPDKESALPQGRHSPLSCSWGGFC